MAIADDLNKLIDLDKSGSDIKDTNTPESWRPRLEVDSDGGYLISTPRNAGEIPDAIELLKEFDLDPSAWKITGVRRSRWQRYDGEWLEAARVQIVPAARYSREGALDVEALIEEVKKWKPSKTSKVSTGDLSAVFAIGDTQWGKDAGEGSAGTVARVYRGLDESLDRYSELIKAGRTIGSIVLPQLGDCIEGSTSQNGKVIGRSDLTVTQQVRLGRRMLMSWVKAFAPLTDSLIIPVVPGNHDEVHRITISEPGDSWQLEIAAAVQDACAENDALAHVQFRYPEKDTGALAINLYGATLGMVHGHQSRDLVKWWQGQATGRTAVGAADVLLTGHFHHFQARQIGPRLWLQVPAMDGGSPWFRERSGLDSPTGLVTFVMGADYDPRRDLAVLAGEKR
jgi:predicted phosphodiesterase